MDITFENQVTQHTWTFENTGQTFTTEQTELLIVNTVEQGLTGADGIDGTFPAINFSFGDASPAIILTASSNLLVKSAVLVIRTIFNGVGAKVSIGTDANPNLLFNENDNNPFFIGSYHSSPNENMLSGSVVKIFITPGAGATTGQGTVIIEYADA
jgi:hypothetical protein